MKVDLSLRMPCEVICVSRGAAALVHRLGFRWSDSRSGHSSIRS